MLLAVGMADNFTVDIAMLHMEKYIEMDEIVDTQALYASRHVNVHLL